MVSFSFLFYGLTVKSVPLVLIGLFIFDEMGHAYNYFFVHNRDPGFGLRMIPYQLDIACGTGNVTVPLARRGAMVTGLDMMPHLLEEARARAAREGLRIRFDEGFAETLPYPDGSFDVLVSMFGIMFSPLPATVASEMARVLRPGGRLALANWTPSGFGGKMSAVVGQYLPPPPQGMISPFLWGEEATVRDRLNPGFDAIETSVVAVRWELQRSAAGSAEFFTKNAGPMQLALGASMPRNRPHSGMTWSSSG